MEYIIYLMKHITSIKQKIYTAIEWKDDTLK